MRKRIDTHVHITGEKELRPKQFIYFTADDLIGLMDQHGIEKAVIQQSLSNADNDLVARAIAKYPDRLRGSMIVTPAEDWKETLRKCKELGLRSVKFEMEDHTAPGAYPNTRYTDEDMSAIFAEAGRLGLVVVIDPARTDLPSYDPDSLNQAIKCHPETKFVLCHLGFPMPYKTEAQKAAWRKMTECFRYENCWVEISAMPALFDWEQDPYPTMLELLAYVKNTYGCDRMIWGTDIPGLQRYTTYSRMITLFEECGIFTEQELDRIFYENALEVYFAQDAE